MNKGQLFDNWKKITLLIINIIILGIACAIVSHKSLVYARIGASTNNTSVVWDFMSRASLSTKARPRLPGLAPTTPPRQGMLTSGKVH